MSSTPEGISDVPKALVKAAAVQLHQKKPTETVMKTLVESAPSEDLQSPTKITPGEAHKHLRAKMAAFDIGVDLAQNISDSEPEDAAPKTALKNARHLIQSRHDAETDNSDILPTNEDEDVTSSGEAAMKANRVVDKLEEKRNPAADSTLENPTNCPSDNIKELPHPGVELPDTMSQQNRFVGTPMKQLSRSHVDPSASTDAPTVTDDLGHAGSGKVIPFISAPMFPRDAHVVAYRGHLLALFLGPGCYMLLSTADQFIWTQQSLKRSEIHNASFPSSRLLHCCRDRAQEKRQALIAACRGIVGVAHRGYHTLNCNSATKHRRRIGDCMIEVEWDRSAIDPPETTTGVTEGRFKTWEIRSDWQAFRGKPRGDWEIYSAAKRYDTGLIPPAVTARPKAPAKSAAIGHKRPKKRTVAKGETFEYSDSE
jgi:hypothetical protein